MNEGPPTHGVSFWDAVRVWVRVAALSFGGPTGQIAVMHRILVEEKRWISDTRFLHALNYCMLLPGPEAQQLATYIGWLLHGTRGGLVAGTLFVLPGFISILVLSIAYVKFQGVPAVEGIFFGLKAAVIAIVIEAVIRIGRRALRNRVMVSLAAFAFLAIYFGEVSFPLIIISAATIGYLGGKIWPEYFYVVRETPATVAHDGAITDVASSQTRPTLGRVFLISAIGLSLWFGPQILLGFKLGWEHVYVQEGLFFSKAAAVTFGGAYSVLAYIGQEAVERYGWLQPGEMLDALGMAETTPGPLIQVVQFVGFMGAFRDPGNLDPILSGVVGSIITTWVTYVPCFMWIFLGAPYIEYLRGNKSLSTSLSAITAAVVGVVLNLAVWFAMRTLFENPDDWRSLNVVSALITVGAFVAMFRFKLGMIQTLASSVLVGAAYYLVIRT